MAPNLPYLSVLNQTADDALMKEMLDVVKHNDVQRLEQLFRGTVNAHGANQNGRTRETMLLHWAAVGGHVDVLRYLVGRDADLNQVDETGQTPLHLATEANHVAIVACLLEGVANLNQLNGIETVL